ncbi:hypothetical protein F1C15_09140 [Frigoribacterium sp. NBH87]|uniref:DUF6049 family protein n=1 Tax=Frigoribacterium sp. NBH87 TaxID=2596916 RepID=UPI0016259C2E|nr:DUF6049 family protein [Frigoribacterium sp. NBH87]QNE43944.1 hypothetical protein F1C15_09140 [Frigoribacterium sp. NBH87]
MRPLHALLAALTAVFVVVVGLPAAATAAPSGSSSPSASSSSAAADEGEAVDGVTLTLSPAADGVLVPGRDLVLDVTVRNASDTDVAAGVARVYLDRGAFATRGKLANWLRPESTSGSDYLGSYLTRLDVPAVPAGSTQTVASVTVAAADVGLEGYTWGARALGARLLDDDGEEVAQTRSSVVWFPGESFQPTRLAVAVPITTPETENGVLDAAALSAYTSVDGTLTRQLRAVQGTGAVVAVDPMIIASVRLLGSSAPPSALSWLDQLQSSGLESFSLAWADADAAALSQAGAATLPSPLSLDPLIDPSLFAEVDDSGSPAPEPTREATPTSEATPSGTGDPSASTEGEADQGGAGDDAGAGTDPGGQAPGAGEQPGDGTTAPPLPTTESLLSWPWSHTGVVWPTDDSVVAADLDVWTASGATSAILSSSNVDGSTDSTENAAVDLGGRTGLVSDDSLTALVGQAAGAPDDAAWAAAVAELSASVATVARERPSDARTLLTALDRDWAAQGPYLHQTLVALAGLPWTTTVGLGDALDAPRTSAVVVDRAEDATRVAQVRTLLAADQRVVDLGTALAQPETVTAAVRLRVLGLTSQSWRDNPEGLASEVGVADAEASATAGLVSVVRGSDQLILGDRSSMPLYVENGTSSAATVYVTVRPSNSILSVEEVGIPVTVQAQSQVRVRVPVQSVANGTVSASITLASVTGAVIGAPSTVQVNVQAGWETALTWVFAVGFVLLFGGGLYRTFRKRRRARDGLDGADGADGLEPVTADGPTADGPDASDPADGRAGRS